MEINNLKKENMFRFGGTQFEQMLRIQNITGTKYFTKKDILVCGRSLKKTKNKPSALNYIVRTQKSGGVITSNTERQYPTSKCAVCLMKYKKEDRVDSKDGYKDLDIFKINGCNHEFCVDCIKNLFIKNKKFNCPYCRAEVDVEKVALQLGINAIHTGDKLFIKQVLLPISDNGSSILHIACKHGHTELIKLLLDDTSYVDVKNNYGETPLYVAFKHGHTQIVKLLIKNKADVNTTDNNSNSLLHIACKHGHTGLVQLLLNIKTDIDVKNSYDETPLHYAVVFNHTQIVKLLIKNKADVNSTDDHSNSLLQYACAFSFFEISKLLIENHAYVNYKNDKGHTPLHWVHQVNLAKLLIENNADVNTRDENKKTILHTTCEQGNVQLANFLINTIKFDVNVKDYFMETPLHYVCKEIDYIPDKIDNVIKIEIAKLLIENKADIDTKNSDGNTPLHNACIYGYVSTVKLLIKNGADINAKNSHGKTPLHNACIDGFVSTVKLLIKNGADINVKDNRQQTPLDIAYRNRYPIKKGHDEIIKLLENKHLEISLMKKKTRQKH
jgi:ankyrin repeat protein